MPKLVQVRNLTFNVALVAPPGGGKTTLAAQAQDHPQMRDVLILDVDAGTLAVAHRGDIHSISIRTPGEFESVFWKLANNDPEFARFKTIVVDNGTELVERGLVERARAAVEAGKRDDEDEVQIQDYGHTTRQLSRLVRLCRKLDRHLIFTTWAKNIYPPAPTDDKMRREFQRRIEQGIIKPIKIEPALPNALRTNVTGAFDNVWFLGQDDKTNQRFLVTQPTGPVYAKTRAPRFAQALGAIVKVRDLNDPKGEGVTLADIFDTLLTTEGGGVEEGNNE